MPADAIDIAYRPVKADDLNMLGEWMQTSHWRRWWGEPEKELGYIRDMIEGRDTTLPYIIDADGAPVGYIQCWFVGEHQTEEWAKDNPWLMQLPHDAVGVDLSIGPEELLSRGIGSAALAAFSAGLEKKGHRTIVIDPDPENARAVRAYARAGFRPVPQMEGKTDGVLIMQYHSNRNGTDR